MKLRRFVPLLAVFFLMWAVPASAKAGPLQESQDKKSADQKEAQKEQKEEEPKTEAEKAKQKELENKACQSLDVHYKTDTDKANHPTPNAPADKALIYVVRPTMWGNKIQTKLAADGQFSTVRAPIVAPLPTTAPAAMLASAAICASGATVAAG